MQGTQSWTVRGYRRNAGPELADERAQKREQNDTIPDRWDGDLIAAWGNLTAATIAAGHLISAARSSDGGVVHIFVLQAGNRFDAYARKRQTLLDIMATWQSYIDRFGYIPTD